MNCKFYNKGEAYILGKRRYEKSDVSKAKTAELGIRGLLVIESDDGNCFCAVHKNYFKKEDKHLCPACGSDKTRSSKVVTRTFKDILTASNNKGFRIIDLVFHQRYFRCDGCGQSVFPEDIDFASKGSRYTNRLSDKLADGTLTYSYKRVCDYYSVPASTASVGAIMRRRTQFWESLMAPIYTPETLAIFEVEFYKRIHPVVFTVYGGEPYCLDILEESTEQAYRAFFNKLDAKEVKTIYIDPVESLYNATQSFFPSAAVVVSDECVLRYARTALCDIIFKDGKRMSVKNKYATLVQKKGSITEVYKRRQMTSGFQSRPRLKAAYDHYQKLITLMDNECQYSDFQTWLGNVPDDLPEFGLLADMDESFGDNIKWFSEVVGRTSGTYSAYIAQFIETIGAMPFCIYDVLRARIIFSAAPDTIKEDETEKRLGVRVGRLIGKLEEVSNNIKEERYYGL